MRFEYNTNLVFDERVELVIKEIMDTYPSIEYNDALIAASHAVPVDDKITNDDKFDRYYFIMKAIDKNHPAFLQVFKDCYAVYVQGLKKDMYYRAFDGIVKYINKELDSFPDLN